MPETPFALEATRESFPQLVLENSCKGPVLVDFWAEWAGPSLRQRDLLLRLAREYGGRFLLVTVNTDKEKVIARELGIKSLPSCKLFRNGRPVEHLHGMRAESDYRELIERHLLPLANKVQAAALRAWEAGDRDQAIQALAEGAVAAPDDPSKPLLLAKLLVRAERHADAHALLSALPPAMRERPEIQRLHTHLELILAARDAPALADLEATLACDPRDSDARFQLAPSHLIADDPTAALDQLVELVRRDPEYRAGLPRRALAAVLDGIDPNDERIRSFRRMLFEH